MKFLKYFFLVLSFVNTARAQTSSNPFDLFVGHYKIIKSNCYWKSQGAVFLNHEDCGLQTIEIIKIPMGADHYLNIEGNNGGWKFSDLPNMRNKDDIFAFDTDHSDDIGRAYFLKAADGTDTWRYQGHCRACFGSGYGGEKKIQVTIANSSEGIILALSYGLMWAPEGWGRDVNETYSAIFILKPSN